MKIKYNVEKLEKITRDLFNLTGMSIAILDAEHNYICKHTKSRDFCDAIQTEENCFEKCNCYDKLLIEKCIISRKHESHICHSGLYDAIMPISKNGVVVCYVLMGRVRCDLSPEEYANDAEINRLYKNVPFFTEKQIDSMASLLTNILFDEAVSFDFDPLAERITEYIKEHYGEDISILSVCERFFVSKNRLYKLFYDYCGITVNEYITETRLAEAKKLLADTDEPVYLIGKKTGFDNCTYFCRIFKRKTGLSPAGYRKESREKG